MESAHWYQKGNICTSATNDRTALKTTGAAPLVAGRSEFLVSAARTKLVTPSLFPH
jgi:hypothetical protein